MSPRICVCVCVCVCVCETSHYNTEALLRHLLTCKIIVSQNMFIAIMYVCMYACTMSMSNFFCKVSESRMTGGTILPKEWGMMV